MRLIGQLAVLTGISLTASAIHFRISGPPERRVSCDPSNLKAHEICLDQVMARWTGKVLWVDARSRKEWQADGVPGSILWSLDPAEDAFKFEEDAMNHLMEEPPAVIVYCGEGNCGLSHQVVEKILKFDVTKDVYALRGGVGALRAARMLKGSN